MKVFFLVFYKLMSPFIEFVYFILKERLQVTFQYILLLKLTTSRGLRLKAKQTIDLN